MKIKISRSKKLLAEPIKIDDVEDGASGMEYRDSSKALNFY